MVRKFRKLQLIFALTKLNPEWFYSIDIGNFGIELQGRYSNEVFIWLSKQKANIKFDNRGYIEVIKHNVRILLTN